MLPEVILVRLHWLDIGSEDFFKHRDWYEHVGRLGIATLIITLLGLLMVSRSLHGRELAVSPMECQINTQSAPDAVDLSQIVTLVSHNYVKSLRHGIYEHENCAKTISDWVRIRVR